MNEIDKEKYIQRYTDRFNKFGYDARTLGWGGGIEKQYIRFSALTEIDKNKFNGSTVLDIGCGFGDLFDYLKMIGSNVTYTGIDIVPVLIETAKLRHSDGEFILGDFMDLDKEKYDYIVGSGLFNAKVETDGGNEEYIENSLKLLFEKVKVGLVVDFMSTHVDYQHEIAYHCDPSWAFIVGKNLSKRVQLKHDYMPYEFCMFIYKDDEIIRDYLFKQY